MPIESSDIPSYLKAVIVFALSLVINRKYLKIKYNSKSLALKVKITVKDEKIEHVLFD